MILLAPHPILNRRQRSLTTAACKRENGEETREETNGKERIAFWISLFDINFDFSLLPFFSFQGSFLPPRVIFQG